MLVLLLFSAGALFASDFNVLVCPRNEKISSYISFFFDTRYYDKSLIENKINRENAETSELLGEALSQAYKSEDRNAVLKAKAAFEKGQDTEASLHDKKSLSVKLLENKGLSYDVQAMLSGNTNFLKFICDENKADFLVIPYISVLQGFNHIALYVYEYGDKLNLIYEEVSENSVHFPVRCLLSLAPYFKGDGSSAILKLDGLVEGETVLFDEKDAKILNGYILTTSGEHSLKLSAQGYADRNIHTALTANEVSSIDASLERLMYSSLIIESEPVSQVYIDGFAAGETPLTLNKYTAPSAATLSRDGYLDTTAAIPGDKNSIKVNLKPEWMGNKNLVKDAKDEFYSDFARSLLIFGAKIALGTFNDGNSKVLKGLDLIANGVLAISIADLAGSLIDYYKSTEYAAK